MVNLYPHQKQALDSTKGLNKVAYYLDMGLGKTFVSTEKMVQLGKDVNVIVCQKSKIDDWVEHIKENYPRYNVIEYKKQELSNLNNPVVIVVNYDLIWRREEFNKLKNFTLILDESSYIKNETSKRSKFIMKLNFENIIMLSGTPVAGKYEELYSQIKLLGWKITKKKYWETYIEYFEMDINGFPQKKVTGYKNVHRLKRKLREHGAVFMKSDNVLKLPNQIHTIEKVKTTSDYKRFKKDRLLIKDDLELVGDNTLTRMLYLRQLASMYNKNKVDKLKELLESTDDRVIIFYNFKYEYELIKELCDKLDKPVSAVNGTVKDLGNYNSKENTVTLCQYQSAAMGINLQKCNKIIYFSLTLSSELFEQSKKRTHRIGQEKTCFYWYLITEKTIDEKIYKTLQERKDYTDKLFEEDEQ